MSYSVVTPCGNCVKKQTCVDGVVITGAVQGIIHPMPYDNKGNSPHKGAGTVTLDCFNKQEPQPEPEDKFSAQAEDIMEGEGSNC